VPAIGRMSSLSSMSSGMPVGMFRSVTSSSDMPSRCLISARSVLPCETTRTQAPVRRAQYASMAPLFEHGVQLWMPEAGGRVDYRSEHDEQAMTAARPAPSWHQRVSGTS
jgi:hypothetical protein